MNLQKPEPHAKGDGATLDVHSIFYTIQGEGPFTGHPAVFVRLAGCNLQCPGCDTEYTATRNVMTLTKISEAVDDAFTLRSGGLVVITGGEPLRQPIGQLVNRLRQDDRVVQIESNGMFEPDELLIAWLHESIALHNNRTVFVVSPKTAKIAHMSYALATAFKYVLDHRSLDPDDGLPLVGLLVRALVHLCT